MNGLSAIQEDLKKLKSMMGAAATQLGADPKKNSFVQRVVDVVPDIVIDYVLQGKLNALQAKTNEIIRSLDMAGSAFRAAGGAENKINPTIEAFSDVAFDTQTVVKTIENYTKLIVGFSEQTVIDRHQVAEVEWIAIQEFYGNAMSLQQLNVNQANFRQAAELAQIAKMFKGYLSSLVRLVNRVVSVHDKKKILNADQAVALGSACAYISKMSDTLVGELRSAEKVRVTIVPVEVEFANL